MHCFESLTSLRGQENLMLKNPALKTFDFCHGEHFLVGKYDIQSTNEIAFKRTVHITLHEFSISHHQI